MKILSICLAKLSIPLKRPFITALRRTDSVEDIVVMITTDCGNIGYGSAAATPAITGETQDSMISAIQHHIAPKLIGHHIEELNHLLHLTDTGLKNNTSAKAAIDMALHDLFAQYWQLLLYKLLGGHKNTLQTSMMISVKDKETMANDAQMFVQEGFTTLKIKLGLEPSEDIARVQAIRAAVGNSIELVVDANQGWNTKSALFVIQAFEKYNLNIRFIEQPVKASDWQGLKTIRERVSSTIIADESCFSPTDALHLAQNNMSDGLNIKLMKSGGIAKAQAIYHIATTAYMNIMVGCMLESPIGITAMASFAVSKSNILLADLDPLALIRENIVLGGAQLSGNNIILPDKPGLGIEGFNQKLSHLCEIS